MITQELIERAKKEPDCQSAVDLLLVVAERQDLVIRCLIAWNGDLGDHGKHQLIEILKGNFPTPPTEDF